MLYSIVHVLAFAIASARSLCSLVIKARSAWRTHS